MRLLFVRGISGVDWPGANLKMKAVELTAAVVPTNTSAVACVFVT